MALILRARAVAVATVGVLAVTTFTAAGGAQASPQVGPIFVDGQAQIVPEFADPATWIRQPLWVETEFDSDGDGKLDRMHVDVTRPAQTMASSSITWPTWETSSWLRV